MNCTQCGQVHSRCASHKSTNPGEPCQRYPRKGAKVCDSHGGRAPQVKAKAEVRAVVERWGLGDPNVDPGKILLRLVSQSAARADYYAAEQHRIVELCDGDLQKALVGEVWVTDESGGSHKSGEYIRALTRLEAEERDRLANFCKIAVAAGLAIRQVQMAEEQGAMFAQVIGDVVRALGHDPSEPATAAVIRQVVQARVGVGMPVLEGSLV